jgi:DNA-directed RNA polymerase subunit K/omega
MEYNISKYEKARIIGTRATHISNGAKPKTDIGKLIDPVKIAEKEFNEGTIPIDLIRNFPNGTKVEISFIPKNE